VKEYTDECVKNNFKIVSSGKFFKATHMILNHKKHEIGGGGEAVEDIYFCSLRTVN
jgi:hypothetical protein